MEPQEVRVAPISPERLREVLDADDWNRFQESVAHGVEAFEGRVIWMVSSTAAGGGVAEMLRSFLAYSRGAGVNVRWLVMAGTPEFFTITKRIHNFLHGSAGDGGELGPGRSARLRAGDGRERRARRGARAETPTSSCCTIRRPPGWSLA